MPQTSFLTAPLAALRDPTADSSRTTSPWFRGRQLRLITTDGGTGVRAALPLVYGEVPHQLCWAHKLRNVAGHQ